MSREEFEHFLRDKRIPICLSPPFDLVPCACGDTNCHGWRFISVFAEPVDALPRVVTAPRRQLRLAPNEHEFASLTAGSQLCQVSP